MWLQLHLNQNTDLAKMNSCNDAQSDHLVTLLFLNQGSVYDCSPRCWHQSTAMVSYRIFRDLKLSIMHTLWPILITQFRHRTICTWKHRKLRCTAYHVHCLAPQTVTLIAQVAALTLYDADVSVSYHTLSDLG